MAVVIAVSPALAQAQTTAGRQIVFETARSFPQGGERLKQRIADLCQQRPEMATEIADFLRTNAASLNPSQQAAIQAGLEECSGGINPLWFALGAAVAGGIAAGVLLNKKDSIVAASPN